MSEQDFEKLLQPRTIPIPNSIDDYIARGVAKAKQRKQNRWKRRAGLVSAATVMLIISFIISVRFSPTFATNVAQLPFMQQIVEIFQVDKGVELAAENEFIQNIDESVKQDGIELTIDHVILDELRVVLFYTLSYDPERYNYVRLRGTRLFDQQTNQIQTFHSSPRYIMPDADLVMERNKVKGKEVLYFRDPQTLPETVNIEASIDAEPIKLGRSISLMRKWELPIDIDREKFYQERPIIPIETTVAAGGQKIHFKQATIYPTLIHLEWEYLESNTKRIFAIEDLRLVDESGTEWKPAVTASDLNRYAEPYKNTEMFFESNYFSQPEKLILKGSTLRAIDKEELEVIVDLETKEIIKSPTDQLEVKDVGIKNDPYRGDYIYLQMSLPTTVDPYIGKRNSIIFGRTYDADGNMAKGNGSQGGGIYTRNFVPGETYPNPITIMIDDYSLAKIVEPFEVELLLE